MTIGIFTKTYTDIGIKRLIQYSLQAILNVRLYHALLVEITWRSYLKGLKMKQYYQVVRINLLSYKRTIIGADLGYTDACFAQQEDQEERHNAYNDGHSFRWKIESTH